jgi:hypothetical protein
LLHLLHPSGLDCRPHHTLIHPTQDPYA